MTPEVNVLALVKGRERFVYVYDDARQFMGTLGAQEVFDVPE